MVTRVSGQLFGLARICFCMNPTNRVSLFNEFKKTLFHIREAENVLILFFLVLQLMDKIIYVPMQSDYNEPYSIVLFLLIAINAYFLLILLGIKFFFAIMFL